MVEKLQIEHHTLLKALQNVYSFILVLFRVVCVVHGHNDQTGWWDLREVFEEILLDDIKKV